MSATIGDDSALIRTFDASPESVTKPITSKSLAGISERMLLVPELMHIPSHLVVGTIKEAVTRAVTEKSVGAVILVPSKPTAANWTDIATFPNSTEEVPAAVKRLQDGETLGPIVFANRYDGIDLPGAACRVLVLSGLPRGVGEYDLFRAAVFLGGSAINTELAQRIEQGIGRGARGANDYCVVLITGKDLVAWISRSSNLRYLTDSTRVQLEMGGEISRSVVDKDDLFETMDRCISRDRDWTQYHAETLAEQVESSRPDETFASQAAVERRAFNLIRDGYYEKAISKLQAYADGTPRIDPRTKGWLLQMAATAAQHWNRFDLSLRLQQDAFASNRNLLRPKVARPYEPLVMPDKQAAAIVKRIGEYRNRRGYLAYFDDVMSRLTADASSNQFEQALVDLALAIGFVGERPEQAYGQGPDVLWLLDEKQSMVIEAKSRKKSENPLTRDEHGQLLNAAEWFAEKYPERSYFRVSVHPNAEATNKTAIGDTKALTLISVQRLVNDARVLIADLCESVVSDDQLLPRCAKLLQHSKLTPSTLPAEYLVAFTIVQT